MIVTDTLFSKLLKSFVAFCAIATLGIAASTPAFADQTSKSLDVNLTLGNSISVRILDSTATSDLSLLSFDLTPTAAGVTSTKRAIVDVSTSNITGYKLYVEANGKDHNNQYTTDLVQGDTADSHVIPTSTSTASNKNFWNYVNPATSTATVVPAHGTPDQIGSLLEPTTSTKANVDINVGVDTTITAGSYTNQLLFTAIANAESIDYTLYFDKNAPSGVDPSDIENFPVNQTASASATSYTFTIPDTAPTLVGYTFGGYVDPTATPGSKGSSADPYLPGDDVTVTADPTASVISGTKTLYAQWQPRRTVTVTAGTGIASTTGSGDYSPGANVSIGAALSTGYHFADPKWTVNSGGVTISNDSFTMPENDVSVTANGAINSCSVHYNSNAPSGETAGGSTANSSFNYGTATATTANGFTVTGYDWVGWAESADGAAVISTSGGSMTAEQAASWCGTHGATKQLYAKWAVKTYTVTVNKDSNTDSVSGGGTKAYKSTVTLSATPKTGYHFSSWTVNSGGVTINNNQFTMPNNAVTVTANSAINTCPITYNSNAPSGSSASGTTADSSMTYNQIATLTTNGYTVTGYQFDGWATTSGGSVAYTTTIPAADAAAYCTTHNTTKTLYAHWTKKYTYTLNLNTNDGTTNKQILNYPSSGGTTDTSHQFTSLNTYAPTRSGYNFLGWATSASGTSYVTSYTLNGSSASSTPTSDGFPVTGNLYAQWEVADPWASITTMQQMTTAACTAADVGKTKTLTDSRDNNEYTVAKLADGKCWMTKNLKLTGSSSGSRRLYPADTDITATYWDLPAVNTDFGTSCSNTAKNMLAGGSDSYGAYYNWYAATAGTGACAMESGNATSSICPRGWRLPTGGSGGEFQTLYNNYKSDSAMITPPVNFVLSGYRSGSNTYDQGSRGYYWSSTTSDSGYAYRLYLIGGRVYPTYSENKYIGLTVRCVAR